MLAQLELLGVNLDGIPSVGIDRCVANYRTISHAVALERQFKVVRRDAHDARLAETMVDRGVTLSEGEAFVSYERREDGLLDVHTTKGQYIVKALVAADGAGSKIARSIEQCRRSKVHLAQIDLPMPKDCDPHAMVYDFSRVTEELFGYVWVFPTPLHNENNQQLANVGLMQVGSTRAGGGMPAMLREVLRNYGFELGERRIKFHPEWAFDPTYAFSAPNILTVGDAAGIDPLFGEGLSQCIEYGVLAARELAQSLPQHDLSFKSYRRRVLWSAMGMEMRIMRIPAQRLYRANNRVWASFIFNGTYLPRLMAAQGEGRVQLRKKLVPIISRALWHIGFGNKSLPS
jgi:flavin-dependent dehydrogenase